MTREERRVYIEDIDYFCNTHRCDRCPLSNLPLEAPAADYGCSVDMDWTDAMVQEVYDLIKNRPAPTAKEVMIDKIDLFCHQMECKECPFEDGNCNVGYDKDDEPRLIQMSAIIDEWWRNRLHKHDESRDKKEISPLL